jgi:putative pyruvate formate lyase activating enzyme
MSLEGVSPLYLSLKPEERRERARKLERLMEECVLCPRRCRTRRSTGERGRCGAPGKAVVDSFFPHRGEERVLSGYRGSGTIFFVHCNLECVFCQNWTISRGKVSGDEVSPRELAEMMLSLQEQGCHNINLVTPTPYVAAIAAAIDYAAEGGLRLPIVYNSSGYESTAVLKLLQGLIDIYMPDAKYGSDEKGERYSGIPDYYSRLKEALKEMQRQVGDLALDQEGLAYRGLLVRHLVLPGGEAGTEELVRFLKKEISPRCAVNIMAQYYPAYRAAGYPPLDRRPTREEYLAARDLARRAGLRLID